ALRRANGDRDRRGAGDRPGDRDAASVGRGSRPDCRPRRGGGGGGRRRDRRDRPPPPPRRHRRRLLGGHRRTRPDRVGPAGHPGQQRRHRRPLRPDLGALGRGVARGAQHRPDRRLPRLPYRPAADAGGRLRPDRQRRLDRRQGGEPERGPLFGGQSGRDRPHQGGRQGGRHPRRSRQLRHPGRHRDPHPEPGQRRAHRLHDEPHPDGPRRSAVGGRRPRRLPLLRRPLLCHRRRLRRLRRARHVL
ncbi:MAG: 3-oxoacyl-[acyl-carrier protein] reductase, partial [uncultured Thermomicrobiales bacterium]